MTVYIVGWYGQRNSGDEAFKLVYQALFPHEEIRWVTDTEIQSVTGDDVVVLGSGDVLREFYVRQIPGETPFFIYGAGIDGEADLQYILSQRSRVLGAWIRSKGEIGQLRDGGINAFYTPDVVFQLGTSDLLRPKEQESKPKKKMVCVFSNSNVQDALARENLNEFLYYTLFKKNIALFLDSISEFYTFDFMSFSHGWNSYDTCFAVDVYSMMVHRANVNILGDEIDGAFQGAVARMRDCDVVLSMKFHGLVYAMLTGRPFINIGHSDKTQKLCADYGFEALSMKPLEFSQQHALTALKVAEQPSTAEKIRELSMASRQEALTAAREFQSAVAAYRATLRGAV